MVHTVYPEIDDFIGVAQKSSRLLIARTGGESERSHRRRLSEPEVLECLESKHPKPRTVFPRGRTLSGEAIARTLSLCVVDSLAMRTNR
jgi:hypothetical protein